MGFVGVFDFRLLCTVWARDTCYRHISGPRIGTYFAASSSSDLWIFFRSLQPSFRIAFLSSRYQLGDAMALDAHSGEGQPVQRRVSYRRLREEEKAKATKSDGDYPHAITGVFDSDSRGSEDNMDADTITANPSSIWQEAWLAVRCGTRDGTPPICIRFRMTITSKSTLLFISTPVDIHVTT